MMDYGPFSQSLFQQFKAENRSALLAKFHKTGLPSHEWPDFVEAEFEAHCRLNPHNYQTAPVRNQKC